MTDFSWPVFYRLTIKNEKELPRYVIPGRRLRINLTLVNELDMFRGDDILAECPIPIRVAAIPIEDNSVVDKDGRMLNHHEISCEIETKNVRIKPVIERNGNGTVIIDLAPSPVLRHDEELMFILQIGISSSSRIFNHIIPVSTSPFVLVSPHSTYAKENLRRERDSDSEDESDDAGDQMDVSLFLEHVNESEGAKGHVHGPNCSHGHKHGHDHDHHHDHHHDHDHHHEHDQDEDELDEDYADEDFDEDWDGEGEDGMWGDEDDEDHNLISSEVLAVFVDDEDLYETPSKPFSYQNPAEEKDTTLADLKGIYHAFVCDPLLTSPLHPQLQNLVEAQNGQRAQAPGSTDASPAAVSSTNNRGMQVIGAGTRRPKALPPALKAKQEAAAAAAAAQTQKTDSTSPDGKSGDLHQYPTIGMSATPGEGAEMFRSAVENPRYRFLDPLNGLFAANTAQNAVTLKYRQTMAMASYAYVKVVQGLSIGGRIWDGAVYLMKVLQRLFMTSHVALDGARCLELGSGTGVLGIWWWQLVQQRTIAQLTALCDKYNVKRHHVEAVMALICNGDFKPATKVFLKDGNDQDDIDLGDVFSITIPTPVYTVANLMKSFLPNQPTMILTDQPKVMSLLEQNARYNTTSKFPLYNQRLVPGSLSIQTTSQTTTISVINQSFPHTQLPLPIAPVTGLHALTCDWNQPLSKHLYKTCGVYIPSSTPILYQKPPKTLKKDAIQVELPVGVDMSQVTLTAGFDTITDLSADLYSPLRSDVLPMYSHYESLENALNSPNKQAVTGLEEMLTTNPSTEANPVPKFVQIPGLDVVFAIECLYNDRYFQSLQNTIVSLFRAHMFAFAQRLYLHNATKATTTQPKLQLPVIVLSYRFRATHEEELIRKTFFESLRQYGLYHTECPLFRLLGENSIHTDTIGVVNTVQEHVLQRNRDRKERESAIRNALGDLDIERQHNTRLAIIFYSPGTVNQTEPEAKEPKVLSPLPYMTANAQFWFKLFQKL